MKNKKMAVMLTSLALLFLLAGCAQSNSQPNSTGQGVLPAATTAAPMKATVNITATGYEPSTVTIAKGGTVTWVSLTDTPNWPASAKHPTHEAYPGSSIAKCGTTEQAGIFDACHGLAKGESFSFTFNSPGQWGYHEHLNVKMFGKVIVTE